MPALNNLFSFYIFIYCCCFISEITAELKIIEKSDWQGVEAENDLSPLQTPVERVIILHTAGLSCNDEDSCKQVVRNIQAYHMKSFRFDDIAYNFMIGNDGNVYEGRGWSFQGAFARGYNSDSIGIAFLGSYAQQLPSAAALEAAQALLAAAVHAEKLTTTYKLLGHRQVQATESPGDALYKEIKKWPHWQRVL